MIIYRYSLLFCLSFTSLAAHAAEYNCPPSIQPTPQIKMVPPNWEAWREPGIKYRHARINVTSGHPGGMAYLKPDNGDSMDTVSVWTLGGGDEYWLVCDYSNSGIKLIKSIGSPQSCRANIHQLQCEE